jgi:RND family efflux transporter MFP subunit
MKRTVKTIGIVVLAVIVVGVAWAFHPEAVAFYRSMRDRRTPPDPSPAAGERPGASTTLVPVEVTSATPRPFEERLVVQGNVEAKRYALVAARIAGTIEELYVDEGAHVIAGETKLFDIDSLKLGKTVAIREQDLAVAACARREKEANAERVGADFNKAKLDYDRHRRLLEQKVVTANVFEQFESRYQQAIALQKHARSLVDLAVEQEKQTAITLEIARKDLRDATVFAPLSGIITRRFREPGEMAEVGKPVVRIDDLSTVEIVASAPAALYGRIVPGSTPVRLSVGDIELGEHPVSYKSPTVDPRFRTFTVKCLLDQPPAGVVPGALVDVVVVLQRREALGVPKPCILFRSGRAVVFAAANGKAQQIPVDTGLVTDDWIEVCGQGLDAGSKIVSTGQVLLDPGSGIVVQAEEAH